MLLKFVADLSDLKGLMAVLQATSEWMELVSTAKQFFTYIQRTIGDLEHEINTSGRKEKHSVRSLRRRSRRSPRLHLCSTTRDPM